MTWSHLRSQGIIIVSGASSSREHDISRRTVKDVSGVLERHEIPHKLVDPRSLMQIAKSGTNCILFNLQYGREGEDGVVSAIAEHFGIAVTSATASASAICLDKWRTKIAAEGVGISTASGAYLDNLSPKSLERGLERVQFPLILKPNTEGSSLDVCYFEDVASLRRQAASLPSQPSGWVLEEYLGGPEYTVAVVRKGVHGLETLPAFQIPEMQVYGQQAKYGSMLQPEVVSSAVDHLVGQVLEHSLRLHKLLGVGSVSRCDYRVDRSGVPRLLEMNHMPGLARASLVPRMWAAAGRSYDDLIASLLMAASMGSDPPYDEGVSGSDELLNPGGGRLSLDEALEGDRDHERILVQDRMGGGYYDGPAARGVMKAAGINSLGPSLLTCALATDKSIQRAVCQGAGVQVPPSVAWVQDGKRIQVASTPPYIVKNRFSSNSSGVHLVQSQGESPVIHEINRHDVHVEKYIHGTEYYIGLLGGVSPVVLPVVELIPPNADGDRPYINTPKTKSEGCRHLKVAKLHDRLKRRLVGWSEYLWQVFDRPPVCRVEWRVDARGEPYLIEFDHTPNVSEGGYLAEMARIAGVDLQAVLGELARVPEQTTLWGCSSSAR